MKLYLLGIYFLLHSLPAGAQSADPCTFVPRAEVESVLSALPSDVIGWANCHVYSQEANIFIISEFKSAQSEAQLSQYLTQFAKKTVESGISHRWLRKHNEKSGSYELVLETKRINNMEPTIHFAFSSVPTSNGAFLFVHSMGRRQTQKIKNQLNYLRLYLTGPKFLSKIKKVT